ncbi:MAG: RdgB/HAM1 family non-canonical purine NTP pyrophosphatase [Bacilli bacterium]|nr:RdgB/HAM1 family non-canonical purine NTP pyrophosphatase [Bacilli bacterium]
MKKIVLASNNKHKIKEFNEILDNVEILTLNDIEFFDEIEETGTIFLENALIKASTISKYLSDKNLDYDVIADDSGLCCEALNGAPGIYSARYAGEHGDSKANREKLINDLKGKDKTAYFNCTIVLYHIDETYEYKEGKTYGKIIEEELGDTSFGYDCIFLSDDLGKTFGEVSSEEKNSVSHRARALEQIKKLL